MTPAIKTLLALAAFLCACALASLLLVVVLGPPRGDVSWPAYLGGLFLMSLLGPLLFAWAMGPGSMGPVWLAVAFLLPGASLAALYFGFIRAHSGGWLAVAAAIWGAFGGFSAWVAIMGSV